MATSPRAKREFDRHVDGTGRGHETEKKHGAGKGNWGTEGQEDLDHEVQESLKQEAEIDASNPQVVRESDAPTDPKLMTLDEYEAAKQKA